MSQAKVEALTVNPGKEKSKDAPVFQATLHHVSTIVDETVGEDGRARVMVPIAIISSPFY